MARVTQCIGHGAILALVSALALATLARPATAQAQNAQPNNVAANQRVTIHSVLPNPESGPEWVELVNESELVRRVFLPVVAVVNDGSGGMPAPAQMVIPATTMSGWQLGDGAGTWYEVPAEMPPVPYGARVIIYFDGAGPATNDYDFSDNLAVLHTPPGLVNVFNDTEGKVILYAGVERTAEQERSTLSWKVLSDE
jgi:hypothetical protein